MNSYPKPNLKQKKVDNLVIYCSDHRFQPSFEWLAMNYGIEKADKIVYPGPSKAIADESLMPAIKVLESLHNFRNIHIFDHTDCGAFGGLEAFGGDEQKEAEAHWRSLEAAKAVLNQVLPRVAVIGYLAGSQEEITSDGIASTD